MLTTPHSYSCGYTEEVTIHDEIEATVLLASCKAVPCIGAKSIMITLTEGGTVNARSGAFTFYISGDGTNFHAYNLMIDNVTNSNSQTLTRVATKTISTATTNILFFDPLALGFAYFKVVPTITDGGAPTGNFTVVANITY